MPFIHSLPLKIAVPVTGCDSPGTACRINKWPAELVNAIEQDQRLIPHLRFLLNHPNLTARSILDSNFGCVGISIVSADILMWAMFKIMMLERDFPRTGGVYMYNYMLYMVYMVYTTYSIYVIYMLYMYIAYMLFMDYLYDIYM